MKKYSNTTEETLVAFHIGRGGIFNNGGHRTYIGQDQPIDHYIDHVNTFVNYENYYDLRKKFGARENLISLLEKAAHDQDVEAQNRLIKWGFDLGEEIYTDANGNDLGLKVNNNGVGRLEVDGEYNTTYVQKLEECSDEELLLIYESSDYKSLDVLDFCKNRLFEMNMILED